MIRKYVIAFGNLFNDIVINRYDKNDTRIQSIGVPIAYGPKEKFLVRLREDPNLEKNVAITLPRIGFEISSMNYAPTRKLSSTLRNVRYPTDGATSASSQYVPVPYDINFTLSIFCKNTDDGAQILEQILPYFRPEFTTNVKLIPEMDIVVDTPVVLQSVSIEDTYEGDFDTRRALVHNLEFTLKGYLYGPVNSSGVILRAIANIYDGLEATSPLLERIVVTPDGTVIDLEGYGFSNQSTPAILGETQSTLVNTKQLRLYDDDESNYVGFKAPAEVPSNVIWTLPGEDGTPGKVLKTTGAKTLYWDTNTNDQFGPKSVTIINPTASENLTLFFINQTLEIDRLSYVILTSGSSTFDFTIKYGSDRTSGTEIKTGGFTASSNTTGQQTVTFDVTTINAGNWIWLESSGASGSVQEFHCTIYWDSSVVNPFGPKSATITNPTASEDVTLFYVDEEVTISQISSVIQSIGTSSVDYTIRYGPDRTAVGTEIQTGGFSATSNTTVDAELSFDNATIPLNNWVWLETDAISGSVQEFHITLDFA